MILLIMKYLTRFLFVYIIILSSIISFYVSVTNEYKKQLSSTTKELTGVEYLKKIYQLSINVANYQGLLELQASQKDIYESENSIKKDIDSILKFQKQHPEYKNDILNKQLSNIKNFNSSDKDYTNF